MSAPEATTLHVEGMDCNNCALGITRKLKKIGLQEVHTDFASGEVVFVPIQSIPETQVRSAIEDIGYHIVDKHTEETCMSVLEKRFYFSLVFTLPLFLTMFMPSNWIFHNPWVQIGLCIPVFLVGVYHFGKSAYGSLKSGVANMDVLILIGSTAAFVYSVVGMVLFLGTPEMHTYLFFETTATIITLVLLGNVLEHRSIQQTTTAIQALTQLQDIPAKKIVLKNGISTIEEVAASAIVIGDQLQINEGDGIPCDGKLIHGEALLDESMITGESKPVTKKQDELLVGGTLNAGTVFKMEATAVGSQTVLSGIIKLVKEAQRDKPPIQKLSDKISSIFVPVVLGLATLTFFLAWLAFELEVQQALMNAIAVLVISCPCAMGLAVPTAVIAGVGRAAKNGILVRGGSTLEVFKDMKYMVFDKTGTLTTGKFKIAQLDHDPKIETATIKAHLLALEQQSSHPIARSVVKELISTVTPAPLLSIKEIKGIGMEGEDEQGHIWKLGSSRLLTNKPPTGDLFLLRNGERVATLHLEDEIKPETAQLVTWLKENKITPVLLSGDQQGKCEAVAQTIGIEKVYAEKLPEEKLEIINELVGKGRTAMVGDGINDAPALARADAGISLGDATQVAMQQAQVILLNSEAMLKIKTTLLLGKHTMRTIRQNLFWAFFYNVIAIPVAAFGFLNPMVAALAMAFSDVIVIGNSIRLKFKKLK